MTETTTPAKTMDTLGSIVVSTLAMTVFLAAIAVAWWTKDTSLPWLLGAAATNATTVVGYWVGSSSGSKGKDATIAQMGAAQAAPASVSTQGTTP